MNKNVVATFEKVSYSEFKRAMLDTFGSESQIDIMKAYENIKLPTRATSGSAGYDFYIPFNIKMDSEWKTIPTGIKCRINDDWCLMEMPKSGLGFKFRSKLANTLGLIDSDYYNNDNNEGHIMVKISSEVEKELTAGDKFVQGILLPYGIATNDSVIANKRNGGMGSTGEK